MSPFIKDLLVCFWLFNSSMYHITDFDSNVNTDDDEDQLFISPKQCLPVEDCDDYEQCKFTYDSRLYLKQVRFEANRYKIIHSDIANIKTFKEDCASMLCENEEFKEDFDLNEPDSIWTCKQLISGVLQNFKRTRKFVELYRRQIFENRSDNDMHFDISSAVRTKQWWFEYCFGSIPVRDNNMTMLRCSGVNGDALHSHIFSDEEDDDDDDDDAEDDYWDYDKVDFDYEKVKRGELILWSLSLCSQNDAKGQSIANRDNNAYAAGHLPQVSFLAELEQTEVVNVLRFCRTWIRHDGYRPRLGLWLYGLLALLDPVQTADVYHELRLLFTRCNQVRIQSVLEANGFINKMVKQNIKLALSGCRKISNPNNTPTVQCKPCDRVIQLRKQHSTLCLVMVIIVHFFGQKDLIDLVDSDNSETHD